MNKKSVVIVLICALLLSSCSNLSSLSFSTATPTLTATPSMTPTRTPIPTKTPTPTLTPRPVITIEPYFNLFPLENPVLPLSKEQVAEVRDCAVENLAAKRYPEKNKSDDLIYLFTPQSSCDWAALAYAYAIRLNDDEKVPEIAKNALGKAIADNIGFTLSTPLFYRYYYDNFTMAEVPETLKQDITKVRIVYKWGGMGEQTEDTIDIRQADTAPRVTLSGLVPATIKDSANTQVKKETVQALGMSLTNLVPIDSQFSLIPCYDNYPDWTATMTMKDGSVVELKTNESNMIYMGGPWQAKIDGQDYLQFSLDFVKAMDSLIQELGLPYGQPMAMTCATRDVFEEAYP